MSLADDLIADLESDGEDLVENGKIDEQQLERMDEDAPAEKDHALDQPGQVQFEQSAAELREQMGSEITAHDLADNIDLSRVNIQSVSRLMAKLYPILERIKQDLDGTPSHVQGINNPTYKLLVEANEYSVEIDNEVIVVHKFIKDLYSKRFAELEKLVLNPVDYTKTVKQIENNVEDLSGTRAEALKTFLPSATVMIITMAAYENRGQKLSEAELDQLRKGCDLLLELDDAKQLITLFVSKRLTVFAPNITQIISSHTAAQLIGFAGGIAGLAQTPSANLPSLGAKRQVSIGFGQTGVRQQGFLYHSELIQSMPPETRKQAMRIVSGKLVLAARVDMTNASTDGAQGLKWRKEINDKLEKLVEPPENKGIKALPVPEDKKSKKRGGKRIRKFKEQFQMTEFQKAQNRMAFGKDEEEYGQEGGFSAAKAGQIRSIQVDNKTRAKMSKGMQHRLQSLNAREPVSGLQSSLAFSSDQGIQLVAPQQPANVSATASSDNRWFSSGVFSSIPPKKDPGEVTVGKHKMDDAAQPGAKAPKTDKN